MNQMNFTASAQAESPSLRPLPQFPLAIMQLSLDAASPVPLYQQLCRELAAAISRGDLPKAGMLPSAKDLAAFLGVGRHTVLAAYSRLSAEGYTVSSRRRGTRIAETAPSLTPPKPLPDESDSELLISPALDIGYRARHWLGDHSEVIEEETQRLLHLPDASLYPRVALGRNLAEEFCRPPLEAAAGVAAYQSAVASLLRQMRGVHCAPEQIIPLRSFEHALDLVVRILIDPGHCAYIENPAPPVVRRSFQLAGAHVIPIPWDSLGPDISKAKGPPARLIFASPSLSFPLGRQIANQRREELLAAAHRSNGLIFENDRYWELALSGRQQAAIQGREIDAPVVYFGSFSESLGRHLPAAYLVVPRGMVDVFTITARRLDYAIQPFVLAAVARFVDSNLYTAHVKGLRTAYAERLSKIADACRSYLPNAHLHEPAGGFTFVLRFPDRIREEAICGSWKNPYLPAVSLSKFYHPQSTEVPEGLVLGFGMLPDRLIEATIKRLSEVIAEAQ